ncbi:MAG: hypothetical protein IJ736_09590, partial [Firmicutes bacterium]|nr:hypothetical protein [Bacillota bacterium]
MKRIYVIILVCIIAAGLFVGCSEKVGEDIEENTEQNKNEYSATVFAMDTVMDIKVYADDEEIIHKAEDEIKRIEALMS